MLNNIFLISMYLLPFLTAVVAVHIFFEQRLEWKGAERFYYLSELFLIFLTLFFAVLLYTNERFIVFLQNFTIYFRFSLSTLVYFLLLGIIISLVSSRKKFRMTQVFFWLSILLMSLAAASAFASLAMFVLPNWISTHSYLPAALKPIIHATLIVLFFCLIKISLKPNFNKQEKQNVLGTLLLIGITSISTLLIAYFMRELLYKQLISVALCALGVFVLVIINVFVLTLYKTQENFFSKLSQMTLQNKNYENQIAEFKLMQEAQEKIRAIKHDLKNEHIILLGLLEKEEIEEARTYLKEELGKIHEADVFYTHNSSLNFLLNQKVKEANKLGVHLETEILLPETTSLENEMLAIILGNLLDNATSAANRLSNSDKTVHLILKAFNHNLLIEVSNKFDIVEEKTRQNRKVEGFGIKNIKNVVAKYNGIYKQSVEGNVYNTSILFLNIC